MNLFRLFKLAVTSSFVYILTLFIGLALFYPLKVQGAGFRDCFLISGPINVSLMKLCTVMVLLKTYQNIYSIYCCLTFVYIYIYYKFIYIYLYIYLFLYLYIHLYIFVALHQHQPMVSMHLSSFAMPVVPQIIVTLLRHRALVTSLLSQGYKVNRLSNKVKKFYGRHTDLVGQYKKNVCQMFAGSVS